MLIRIIYVIMFAFATFLTYSLFISFNIGVFILIISIILALITNLHNLTATKLKKTKRSINQNIDNSKILELLESQINSVSKLLIPNDLFEKSELIIDSEDVAKHKANIIIDTLAKFKIGAEYQKYEANATLTTLMFRGIDYIDSNNRTHPFDSSKINSVIENIKLNLGTSLVTFIPIVEGQSLFAFEVKSMQTNIIKFGNIIDKIEPNEFELNYIVGQKTTGEWLKTNIINHPHSLIVGATNSGKSTFANSMLSQLIITKTQNELELWISDNKVVEFAAYEEIPHTKYFARSYEETVKMLDQLIDIETYRSNTLFQQKRVKNIVSYNKKSNKEDRLPFIVVLIDEFPTLVETDKKVRSNPFMSNLNILLSKARAAGIYIHILSQNAKATTIDTTLRGNLQCRIVLTVADQNDSNTAGVKGAELLNGFGDLIFKLNQYQERAQSPFISDEEIEKLINYVRDNYK